MIVSVIMAGGKGARLWPHSRTLLLKQFIHFSNLQGSLFQNTLIRLAAFVRISHHSSLYHLVQSLFSLPLFSASLSITSSVFCLLVLSLHCVSPTTYVLAIHTEHLAVAKYLVLLHLHSL